MKKFFLGLILTLFTNSGFAGEPYPEWTLYTPFFNSTTSYLVDLDGVVAHTWESNYQVGTAIYLLDDGRLLRCCSDPSVAPFAAPGAGGRLEIMAWDGTVEWSYVVAGASFLAHNDVAILPNGNILATIWEIRSGADAIAMGRDPANAPQTLITEAILEIEPVGATGGNIVWEWHVWDHLVQDFDPLLPNFGSPSDFPGRVDINFPGGADPDWLHINAIDYNAELDQVMVGTTNFDEVWVISHDPADNGELIYRWGNPVAYGRGTPADQILEGQHHPHWIPTGLPGAGNIIVYNNGTERGYSSIDEIIPPLNPDGTYALDPVAPYGPAAPITLCDTIDGLQFYSPVLSSVQRLPNGNHFICVGAEGDAVEVDSLCQSVWNYDLGGFTFRAERFGGEDPRLEGLLWFADPLFLRGDANGDGLFDVADSIVTLDYLFGFAPHECPLSLDANDDDAVDIADAVTQIDSLFQSGGPLPEPFGQCGADPTLGALPCDLFGGCP